MSETSSGLNGSRSHPGKPQAMVVSLTGPSPRRTVSGWRAAPEAAAAEAGVSRIYGGIHYRFDVDAGLAPGRTIGRYVLEHGPVGREPLVLE